MNKEQEKNLSLSDNSVIDKLLGRLPIWPSPPPPPPTSSSNLSLNDAGLELLNLLQQSKKESSELDLIETSRNSLSIVDRLNEAIRQAQFNNNSNPTTNTDNRIAVQA
jgi:hypothetical protein